MLGGRIFFKGFRYHGRNETILIEDGYITWKYWLRRVREADALRGLHSRKTADPTAGAGDGGDASEAGRHVPSKELPCRLSIKIRGLEWFVYNRTPAYDAIETTIRAKAQEAKAKDSGERSKEDTKEQAQTSVDSKTSSSMNGNGENGVGMFAASGTDLSQDEQRDEVLDSQNAMPMFLNLLPIRVECNKSAITMGNPNTSCVFTLHCKTAKGHIDARTPGPQDLFRQSFDFDLEQTVVEINPNGAFEEKVLTSGARLSSPEHGQHADPQQKSRFSRLRQTRHAVLHDVYRLVPFLRRSVESFHGHHSQDADAPGDELYNQRWLGLSRYLDDDKDARLEQERWKAIQYAQITTLADCSVVGVSFFWDVPGPVASSPSSTAVGEEPGSFDVASSSGDSPVWGLDLRLGRGTINYSPWADRQRAELQSIFFPQAHVDSIPEPTPRLGQLRVNTTFKVSVTLNEQMVLRLYTREESKDWKYRDQLTKSAAPESHRQKKHAARDKKGGKRDSDLRPAGWLELTIPADSSVSFLMDMFAHDFGFHNTLNLDVKSPSMTSSVNHDLIWRSSSLSVSCDLSNPLGWNAPREWTFDIAGTGFELFLLRDHIFLLTDLINDWTSGPSAEFMTFVPFRYVLRFSFADLTAFFNVNELNIINRPTALEDNAFLLLKANPLAMQVEIPMLDLEPPRNKISFDGHAADILVELNAPSWNTQNTFLDGKEVASLNELNLHGSYDYLTSTSSALTDTLVLNVKGEKPVIHLHGVLVKYFLILEANYLGKDMHFQTLEEYQRSISTPSGTLNTHGDAARKKVTNDLDVILKLEVVEGSLRVPALLYSAIDHIHVDLPRLALGLRFTNYYMDLAVTVNPLTWSLGQLQRPNVHERASTSKPQLYLNSLTVSGHRLFGLPPTEPTYVCNWDFDVGALTGECSLDFLNTTVAALRAFTVGLADAENSLQQENVPVLHDVTFLRATLKPLTVWVLVDESAFCLSLDSLTAGINDWAGSHFSEQIYVSIPNLVVACMATKSIPFPIGNSEVDVESCAYIKTTVDVRRLESKAHFAAEKQLQQDHVSLHDSRTQRTPWLLHNRGLPPSLPAPNENAKLRPPAMPFPPMPDPLGYTDDGPGTLHSGKSLRSDESISSTHRQSSFLSSRYYEAPYASSGDPRQLYSAPDSGMATSNPVDSPTPESFHAKSVHAPMFPLLRIRPEAQYLPVLADSRPPSEKDSDLVLEEQTKIPDDEVVRVAFLVTFGQGVQAFFTPEALLYLNHVLSKSQPQTLDNVLDSLQHASIDPIASASKTEAIRESMQVKINLSNLALRLHHHTDPADLHKMVHESVDVGLWDLKINAQLRSSGPSEDFPNRSESVAFQGSVSGVKLSVYESSDIGMDDLAQIEVVLEEALAWVTKSQETVGQAQFHRLGITGDYREVQHLAELVGNTLGLGELLAAQFSSTNLVGKQHLQSIVHFLATTHQNTADPAALTQASYVLRAASLHPRSSDEWKLMCRLRWISRFVTDLEQRPLLSGASAQSKQSPERQLDDFVKSFNDWRSWDLSNSRSNLLTKHVYGAIASDSPALSLVSIPLNLRLNSGEITMIIDPGPQESKLYFNELVVAVRSKSYKPIRSKDKDYLIQESVAQVACAEADVHFNWDLCALARDVMVQLRDRKPSTPNKPTSPAPKKSPHVLQDVHVVLGLETTKIHMRTKNLKASSNVQNFAASVVLKEDSLRDLSTLGTVSAHFIQSELASAVRVLVTSRLQQPILHAALIRRQSKNGLKQILRGGAFCGNLKIDILEDMLGLLGAVDRVLGDEFTYLKDLFPGSGTETRTSKRKPILARNDTDRQEFSVSLLVDSYSLSATVLSSLKHLIKGETARSSTEVVSGETTSLTTDFDLKTQNHLFQNEAGDSVQDISHFRLPPLNGRLSLELYGSERRVDTFVSIEQIAMDASEVHALVSALSRRELSNFWKNVARDAQLVSLNYDVLVAKSGSQSPQQKNSSSQPMLLYSGRVAAAGLRVTATAGGSSTLVLDLGRIHLEVFNKDFAGVQPLVFPEVTVDLTSVNVQLHRSNFKESQPSGDFALAATFHASSRMNDENQLVRAFEVKIAYFEINLYSETAPMMVDVLGYLQQRFKDFSLSDEINTFRARRRRTKSQAVRQPSLTHTEDEVDGPTIFFTSMYSIDINGIQVSWRVGDLAAISPGHEVEDLVFSIGKIDLATRKENVARISLSDLQLQMVPTSQSSRIRSRNSALMPELVFNVAYRSTAKDRRLAFLAVGKSVDLRLTSQFVLPANDLQRSIALATRDLREVLAGWNKSFMQEEEQSRKILGNKRLASLLVDVDFAGAVVHFQSNKTSKSQPIMLAAQSRKYSYQSEQPLRSPDETANTTTLRTPGIAVKVEYQHVGENDPSLNAEIKVEASSNTLQPSIVPLMLELSSSIREIVEDQQNDKPQFLGSQQPPTKLTDEDFMQVTDPSAILGNCSLNVGLRICKQEFGLTCQPIAKVAASALFENIYISVNTVQTAEQNRFFAVSALFSGLQASVRHAYSRESTGRFVADSIHLSLMNSRHVSNLKGVSAILRFSPITLFVNARQLNDFLMFREIWLPVDAKDPSATAATLAESHTNLSVQRYQQVAAAGGFPWNATISFKTLDIQVDLGQALGNAAFAIEDLWLTSRKQSDWEQNLCIGFEKMALSSTGRLSGSLELQHLGLRTSIQWPETKKTVVPLVQASLGFDNIHAKAAFEYQAFFVADLSSLDILMFNVRADERGYGDRLVATVNSDKVQAFITTQSAAQTYSVYQAIRRMIQEKQTAYENSIREIELYYRRRSSRVSQGANLGVRQAMIAPGLFSPDRSGIQLQTNVVVSLRAVNVGAYPKTFFDSTIFKLEALDATATFSVRRGKEGGVASRLGLQLGQVRIALSNVPRTLSPKPFEDMAVAEVVVQSTSSRGGTILKVPRLVATMRTRQVDPKATHIEYSFKSSFEGRVEVGWNINRINYIRNMWETHSKALNQRLGRSLTQSRVQITGVPRLESNGEGRDSDADARNADKDNIKQEKGEKITAVVNMPQSRYTYTALEPPIIETPQLRDMGEATPPLEWIGLHRDRLPNVTHQIVIVPLLEIAKEVEDAYARILGT